jgi:hypothetical protein
VAFLCAEKIMPPKRCRVARCIEEEELVHGSGGDTPPPSAPPPPPPPPHMPHTGQFWAALMVAAPKQEERVETIVLVCNWPHSVGQNHFFVKMLFIRDSAIQKCSRRFCTICKSENSVPCQPFGRRVILSGRLAVQCINRLDNVTYRPDAH